MARILVLSDLWLPFPGGAEVYISHVADALADRGHEIRIITSYEKATSKHSLEIISNLTGLAISSDWDIVITHHHFAEKFPSLFTSRIPSIEIVHSRDRNPNAPFAIFNSQFTANNHGFRNGDLVMLPPVDNSCVALGNPFDREFIGHVKPLYMKGINHTYRLARIMRDRKFLVLRGEWQSLELLEELPNVSFMEPRADIREFYAKCRIVLMPSLKEDAGTVPLECALNGIPCISTNVGGLPETNAGGIRLGDDIVPWLKEATRLELRSYYSGIVKLQRAALPDWKPKFDEIDRRVRQLCAKPA